MNPTLHYVSWTNTEDPRNATKTVQWWPRPDSEHFGECVLIKRDHRSDMWKPPQPCGTITFAHAAWWAPAVGCPFQYNEEKS